MEKITQAFLLRCVTERKNYILLNIEVKPGSKSAQINGINEWRNTLEVSVKSRAERGKANQEVIKLLSDILKLPLEDITIVKGDKSRQKVVKLSGIDSKDLIVKLHL